MGQNLTGKLISNTYGDLVQISGSKITNGLGVDINSLNLSASFATTALTASSTPNAVVTTSQPADDTLSFTKGNGTTSTYQINNVDNAVDAQTAISASFAQTASFALNVVPLNTGSFVTTASISNATTTFTKADGSTFALTTNNVNNAVSASYANTASVVAITDDNGNTEHKVLFANTTVATSGEALLIDPTAGQFTYNPQTGILSTTASFAQTASFALNATAPFPFTGTASITGQLQVTGSATIKSASLNGDLIDNLTTPTASDAVKHVVSLSATDYQAIANPDPNTFYIINDSTGSLILGDTIVSGSLTVTGTLNAPGLTVPSASYAQTASLALTANNGFPYTGSAQITGSLGVSGSLRVKSVGTPAIVNIEPSFGSNTFASGFDDVVMSLGTNISNQSNAHGVAFGENHTIQSFGYNTFIGGGLGNTIVAGANRGAIIGGNSNTLNGQLDAAVVGGLSNTAGGQESAVVGGDNNQANGYRSAVLGGEYNVNTGTSTTAIGGYNNTMNGSYGAVLGTKNSAGGGDSSVIVGGSAQNMLGNQSAIIAGNNNTIGSAYSESVVLGGNNLAVNKNSEVVVPNLTVSGSLDLSGSLNIQNNDVTDETIFQANFLKNVTFSKADYSYTIDTNGSVTNIHISESATYLVSSSAALTNSASVNLYYYPEMLSRNEVAFVYYETPARATAAIVYQVRTLPTITGSGNYWYPNSAPGAATTNINAAGSSLVGKRSSTANQNCHIMFKDPYDQVYFSTYGSFPIAAQVYLYYTSSQGTPL